MKPSLLIENLINYRNEDKERCNMLLLMLVVSSLYVISIFLFQGRGCQFLSVFTALTFGMAPLI